MKKTIILSLLTAIALAVCSATVYAKNEDIESDISLYLELSDLGSEGFDTLDFTQANYIASTTKTQTTDEIVQIGNVCKAYIASSRAYVRDSKSYSNLNFISQSSIDKSQIKYRLSELDYLVALNKEMGWEIIRDNLVFDNLEVKVNGQTATTTVGNNQRQKL